MKRSIRFQLLLISLLLSACYKDFDQFKDYFDEEVKPKLIIINPNFEWPIDFNAPERWSGWVKQGWIADRGIFLWDSTIGRNNSGGLSIDAGSFSNDLYPSQQIFLDPSKIYRLSAWVKTEKVYGGAGANICLYGTYVKSESVYGTTDWKKISLDIPPNSSTVTIACRLGFWSATSTGKAYFDDVSIEEVKKFVEVGNHIKLIIDGEDASAVKPATITTWIANLDKAYEKYFELMGHTPYNGDRITIFSVNNYPNGWAVAGNPILWHKPYVRSELLSIQSTGTWSFGIMHELGHDFNPQLSSINSWVFNEEMFANLRMYYVVEKLNATIKQGKVYKGPGLLTYYKDDAGDSYRNTIERGIARGHDGIMYTLLRIKNKVGWSPFIKTIRDLNSSELYIDPPLLKFNLFLDKLSYYSKTDVRQTYLPGELETIAKMLK